MATYKNKKIIIDGNGDVCCAKVENDVVDYAVKFLTVKVDEDNYEQKKERFMKELMFGELSENIMI